MQTTIVIEDISTDKVQPAFEKNNVPVCLFSSNEYSPYCGVLIYSIIANSSENNNYDIIIIERSISEKNKRLLTELVKDKPNFSIRFLDVSLISKNMSADVHGHFALEGSLKLYLLTDIFIEYDKFVTTDSDLVFNNDIAQLYNIDVDNYYFSAVDDIIMKSLVAKGHLSGGSGNAPKIPAGEYISDYLNMGTDEKYYNTGVVVFNLKKCRNDNIFSRAFDLINTKAYWFVEQDVLNEVCSESILDMDIRWNVLYVNPESLKDKIDDDLYIKYIESLDDYNIMHFAGAVKPWLSPNIEYSERFYKYARLTPWYENIVFNFSAKYSQRVSRDIVNEYDRKKQIQLRKKASQPRFFKSCINDIIYPPYSEKRERHNAVKNRLKDNRLTQARNEMMERLHYMEKNRYKGKEYYENYQFLCSLKNKYKGQRCFIVGNGPSLRIDDLECIKNEISFGMNSIPNIFSETEWRPNYYVNNDIMLNYKMRVPQDERYKDLIECLSSYDFKCCLISSSKYNKQILEEYKGKVAFLPTQDYLYMLEQPRFPDVKCDISKSCTAFGTTAFLIYQIAVYMGFSKIYFIGTDCDYTSGRIHVYDDNEANVKLYEDKKVAKSLEEALFRGFCAINRDALKRKSVEVYNATRGGKLEVFERVDFDSIEGLRR